MQKGEGYEEAAERLVTLAEDPKILGVSSKSVGVHPPESQNPSLHSNAGNLQKP